MIPQTMAFGDADNQLHVIVQRFWFEYSSRLTSFSHLIRILLSISGLAYGSIPIYITYIQSFSFSPSFPGTRRRDRRGDAREFARARKKSAWNQNVTLT